ncbi:MAG: folate-binding protein YgfZ [Oceanospirillaceae bacterium]|nr:folate-binding protein YgfZ [Oceanospirillaceae bacterium]
MTTSASWNTLLNATCIEKLNSFTDSSAALQISPLDYQALFSISGADSQSFLQGQLTCDMRDVSSQGSRLAAHCTPKGAMVSAMRVVSFNDSFLLRVNSASTAQCITALNKYMMFSKAQATDLSEQWVGFGISGNDALSFISNHFDNIPTDVNQSITEQDKVLIKVPGNRYEAWLTLDEAKKWLAEPLLIAALAPSTLWHKLDIINGIADVYPQTSGMFIPQMCNLQALAGVSFNKGCYTGQEVITRLHFRGKLNKQLIIAQFQLDDLNNENYIAQLVNSKEQNNVGKVLQSCIIENICYLQIIINHSKAENALHLDNDTSLKTLPLPYILDPDLFTRKV